MTLRDEAPPMKLGKASDPTSWNLDQDVEEGCDETDHLSNKQEDLKTDAHVRAVSQKVPWATGSMQITLVAMLLVAFIIGILSVAHIFTAGRAESSTCSRMAGDETSDKVKSWWDNKAHPTFQHLDRDYVFRTNADWPDFLKRFDWKGKRVIDYGIGAGFLGEVLFKSYGISEYVGIDISYKSLSAARDTLDFARDRVTLCLAPHQFAKFAPDIFVTQQVIQHFPSVAYLEEFLGNVDSSNATKLMIHFRESNRKNQTITDQSYDKGITPTFALLTDIYFVQSHLRNYANVWSFRRPMCCNTMGTFTGWTLKHL